MIINGTDYKIVYLDTNAMSEFVNNSRKFTKNFIEKFFANKYMFVTSLYNILELNRTQLDFKSKIRDTLGLIPLGILTNIEQITLFDSENVNPGRHLIMFGIGDDSMFNVNIDIIFSHIIPELSKDISNLFERFQTQLSFWKEKRKCKKPNWQSHFSKEIEISANEIIDNFPQKIPNLIYDNLKCVKVMAYIKNMFIHNSSKELKISSLIDSYDAAYFPYVDVYVTERAVGAWLENCKDKFSFLDKQIVYKISDFYSK